MTSTLCDPRAEAVLARLEQQAKEQDGEMSRYYAAKRQSAKRMTDPDSPADMGFVRDKLVALDPERCDLCYLLCRSIKMRHLRPGAMVLCDNVESYEREYSDYTSRVRDPSNGFRSVLLSHQGGVEISVKLD